MSSPADVEQMDCQSSEETPTQPTVQPTIAEQVPPQQMESEPIVVQMNGQIDSSSVMASTSVTTAAISVSLHPLVIMNVSEHWTRIRAEDNSNEQVIGALIGRQSGRNIEIMNSFELNFDRIESDIIIDRDYYTTKESQFKQVFPELDFLGWYSSGDAPNESDMKIHKQIIEINESPLFLKLNPMVCILDLNLFGIKSLFDSIPF